MRTQTATFAVFLLPFIYSSALFGQACPPSAPDGYFRSTACTVIIDRNNPASPATILVPGNTTVNIHLVNARANEAITFNTSTTQAPPVDVAATFLKSAITPLQSLIISQMATNSRLRVRLPDDPIANGLNAALDEVNRALAAMADASVQLSCLEAYRVVTGTPGSFECSVSLLNTGSFPAAKDTTINALLAGAKATLPVASTRYLDTQISNAYDAASKETDTAKRTDALTRNDQYSSALSLLKAAITDAQKTQTTMFENAEQLATVANAPAEVTFPIVRGKSYSGTITIVAQEVVSKTNTTVATVNISWQTNQWEVSTGIMFSALRNRSFSNAPYIVGGLPQLDSAGKTLTVVQESDTRPTVMVPLVMLNYRIRGLSNFPWENKCPNHCAVVLSGGVGLNTALKSAEFFTGPSFQFGSVLITPGAHVGRDTELSTGVMVGAKLGSSPPSPLPTSSRWTVKLGFAVSYVLPF